MNQLMVVNFEGTIVPADGSDEVAKGFLEFTQRYEHIIISSYLGHDHVSGLLARIVPSREFFIMGSETKTVSRSVDPAALPTEDRILPSLEMRIKLASRLSEELQSGVSKDYINTDTNPDFEHFASKYNKNHSTTFNMPDIVLVTCQENDIEYARMNYPHKGHFGYVLRHKPYSQDSKLDFKALQINSPASVILMVLGRLSGLQVYKKIG